MSEKTLAYAWMDEIRAASHGKKPSPDTIKVLINAYEIAYDLESDGCSKVSEAGWPIKYPPCVGHDYLYFRGERSRAECDAWFYRAMVDFGMTRLRARVRWLGVRLGGWKAWNQHRTIEND